MRNINKYTSITISVAFFLILIVSVLAINFYVSLQIEKNEKLIDITAKQSMLSQQIAKDLLQTEVLLDKGEDVFLEYLKRLQGSSTSFDNTLNAMINGGKIKTSNGNQAQIEYFYITPYKNEEIKDLLRRTKLIWEPLYSDLLDIFDGRAKYTNQKFKNEIYLAGETVRIVNLDILNLMNGISERILSMSEKTIQRLRTLQIFSIVLAIFIFFVIVFIFVKKLKNYDKELEKSKKETEIILDSVDQGLFLIDEKMKIGQRISQSTKKILSTNKKLHGLDFIEVMEKHIYKSTSEKIKSNIENLFNTEEENLSPLEIIGKDRTQEKHLKFNLTKTSTNNKKNNGVLISITDITDEINLNKKMINSKKKNDQRIEAIIFMIKNDTKKISSFIGETTKKIIDMKSKKSNIEKGKKDAYTALKEIKLISEKIRIDASELPMKTIQSEYLSFGNIINEVLKGEMISKSQTNSIFLRIEQLKAQNNDLKALYNNLFIHSNKTSQ